MHPPPIDYAYKFIVLYFMKLREMVLIAFNVGLSNLPVTRTNFL